jgi:hypothetical protein
VPGRNSIYRPVQICGTGSAALAGMARVRAALKGEVYGVLGNHDSIRMVPVLEEMGIRMLLNECEPIRRGDSQIYLAGIDDAHFYRADNIEKAASGIPSDAYSILLSHTPDAEFKLLLCTNRALNRGHAAAVTSRHVCMAEARSARCVFAELRWRWTLKVL